MVFLASCSGRSASNVDEAGARVRDADAIRLRSSAAPGSPSTTSSSSSAGSASSPPGTSACSYRAALQAEMVSMLAKYVPGGVWTPAARVVARSERRDDGPHRDRARVDPRRGGALGDLRRGRLRRQPRVGARTSMRRSSRSSLFALVCLVVLHPRIFGPLMTRLMRRFGVAPIEPLPFSDDGRAARLLLRHLDHRRARALLPDPQRRRRAGLATIPFLGGVGAVGAIVAVLVVFAPSGLGVREASMYGAAHRRHEQLRRARRDDPQPARDHARRGSPFSP